MPAPSNPQLATATPAEDAHDGVADAAWCSDAWDDDLELPVASAETVKPPEANESAISHDNPDFEVPPEGERPAGVSEQATASERVSEKDAGSNSDAEVLNAGRLLQELQQLEAALLRARGKRSTEHVSVARDSAGCIQLADLENFITVLTTLADAIAESHSVGSESEKNAADEV
jgi:hypothetical protein